MNEFDQFIKHTLKIKYYARYTDDFVIVSDSREYLNGLITSINNFFETNLKLKLHPGKIDIRKYKNGIDFLGYVILPHYKVMRKRTRKRILRKFKTKVHDYRQGKISGESLNQSLQSYLGSLSHANEHKFSEYLKNQSWFID